MKASTFQHQAKLNLWAERIAAQKTADFRLMTGVSRTIYHVINSITGKSSSMLYSLAETAKANLVNTYQYFELLLTEIPNHMNDNDLSFIDKLLPWSPYVQETCPSRYKKS